MAPTRPLSLNKYNGSELSNAAPISLLDTSRGLRVFLDTVTLSRVVKHTATMTYVKLLKPRFLHLLLLLLLLLQTA